MNKLEKLHEEVKKLEEHYETCSAKAMEKNNLMVICDNCEDGIELDTWDECMEYMRDNDWKRKLVDGKYNNYCPECQRGKDGRIKNNQISIR